MHFSPDSYTIPLTKENLVIIFYVESVEDDQRKSIEKIVKCVEDIQKWPKTMMNANVHPKQTLKLAKKRKYKSPRITSIERKACLKSIFANTIIYV